MRDMRWKASLLCCFALGLPRSVDAGYLQIVSSHEVTVDREAGTIDCQFTIGNTGDENAKEIGIEVPDLNENYPLFPTLGPAERKTSSLSFRFDQLGISLPGTYLLPYRITYKDANYHPFSAPNLLEVTLPPAPARTVTVQFEGYEQGKSMTLSGEESVTLTLRNLSGKKIEVTDVKPFTAAEIVATVTGLSLPASLEPQEKRRMELQLENVDGLAGSSYPAGVVVAGAIDGRHFAEGSRVLVEIAGPRFGVRNLFQLAIVLLVLGIFGYWLLRGRRSAGRRW